eukprot:6182882-Pleurochrysis_carterae.AAC.1
MRFTTASRSQETRQSCLHRPPLPPGSVVGSLLAPRRVLVTLAPCSSRRVPNQSHLLAHLALDVCRKLRKHRLVNLVKCG